MVNHTNGVRPVGTYYISGTRNARENLGLLQQLSDEVLLQIFGSLDDLSLGRLATLNRVLYCFASHEELWRSLALEELEGNFRFQGTWKATYLLETRNVSPNKGLPLRFTDVFSDALYQPTLCAKVPIKSEWTTTNNIDRRANLSTNEFQEEYEFPKQPVIITDVVREWTAATKWNREYFKKVFAENNVMVGEYAMDFQAFLDYSDNNNDDMPLYLFDSSFITKFPSLASDFQVPKHFAEDLFAVLGDERPDYRWLTMGPVRSGSSFHKDPNGTSAWNAVITGSKKWILYPPSVTPPGVIASKDGANMATPVSLMEWFLSFYAQTQIGRVRPRECIVRAGDLLFVPNGWWHLALNLEETIAITQNYVSRANIRDVLQFLATGSEDLISGVCPKECKTMHDRFLSAVQEQVPEAYKAATDERQRDTLSKKGPHEALPPLFSASKEDKRKQGTFRFLWKF